MNRTLHAIAGVTGHLCIVPFWTSTVLAEAFGSHAAVLAVKTAILWGLLVLVPAMAAMGAIGFRMAGRAADPHIVRKRRRMPFIALNGLLVLVPCAVYPKPFRWTAPADTIIGKHQRGKRLLESLH